MMEDCVARIASWLTACSEGRGDDYSILVQTSLFPTAKVFWTSIRCGKLLFLMLKPGKIASYFIKRSAGYPLPRVTPPAPAAVRNIADDSIPSLTR